MLVQCKCGLTHSDMSKIKIQRNILNNTRMYCKGCGRRVNISRYSVFVPEKNYVLEISQ